MLNKACWAGIGAVVLGVVGGLAVGCSGASPASPRSEARRVMEDSETRLGPRSQEVLAKWFEDLPSPLPAPLGYVDGSSTIVVLPDTQVYSDKYPDIFAQQTRWIADNREATDTRFVLHVGDVTEYSSVREWEAAAAAMGNLTGLVPFSIAPGNHDYGINGRADSRHSLFSTYFPVSQYQKMGTFGGTYERKVSDNSCHLFSAGGHNWIAVMLEWGPRRDVLAWANNVLRAHSNRMAIVVTHAYMFHDDTRYNRELYEQAWNPYDYPTADLPGGVSDGEDLWRNVISLHGNVAMVLSGHILGSGVGYLASTGAEGNTVHQMASNFQMLPQGGQGYLRLLEILPDGETVQVKTYSPVYDDYRTDPKNQFVIKLNVKLTRPGVA